MTTIQVPPDEWLPLSVPAGSFVLIWDSYGLEPPELYVGPARLEAPPRTTVFCLDCGALEAELPVAPQSIGFCVLEAQANIFAARDPGRVTLQDIHPGRL